MNEDHPISHQGVSIRALIDDNFIAHATLTRAVARLAVWQQATDTEPQTGSLLLPPGFQRCVVSTRINDADAQ